jgi:hypothetical protein
MKVRSIMESLLKTVKMREGNGEKFCPVLPNLIVSTVQVMFTLSGAS